MTTTTEIINRLCRRLQTSLGSDDQASLLAIMTPEHYHKGETILEEGKVSRNIYFVEKGLIRQYYFKNGIDITEHFSTEDDIIYCFESMIMRSPTELMIEALEECTIHAIPYEELMALCRESMGIKELYCRLLEDGLLESLRKCDVQRFENARERYENFVRQYPEAARRAAGKHIASYLLMTPESLSRVKAGLL